MLQSHQANVKRTYSDDQINNILLGILTDDGVPIGATHLPYPTQELLLALQMTKPTTPVEEEIYSGGMTSERLSSGSKRLEEVLYDQRGLTLTRLRTLEGFQARGVKPKLKVLVVGGGTCMPQGRVLIPRLEEAGVDYEITILEMSPAQYKTSKETLQWCLPELMDRGEIVFFETLKVHMEAYAAGKLGKIRVVCGEGFEFLAELQKIGIRNRQNFNLVECPESIMHFWHPKTPRLSFLRALVAKNRAAGRAGFIVELARTLDFEQSAVLLHINDCGMNLLGIIISWLGFAAVLMQKNQYERLVYRAANESLYGMGLKARSLVEFDLSVPVRAVSAKAIVGHGEYLLKQPEERIPAGVKKVLHREIPKWRMMSLSSPTYYNIVAIIGRNNGDQESILDETLHVPAAGQALTEAPALR